MFTKGLTGLSADIAGSIGRGIAERDSVVYTISRILNRLDKNLAVNQVEEFPQSSFRRCGKRAYV
jgi:hypothetical protein